MPAPDRVAKAAANADPNVTTEGGSNSPQTAIPPTATQRYPLGDEIARGGMGVVYRATDTMIGREVAVKVLLGQYGPESGAARRFADEARIAGQLQHPAIPPVHDLGTLPDGRPFLAMKLIKGATLDLLLEARPDPSADRGRFVAAFEQICHALAYAHSRNVIHRDLKPANVMVGSFGEVQVMDWGLAKVLGLRSGEARDPEETTGGTQVGSSRESDGSFTQAGSVLGTPSFMPPEQAAGAVGKIDSRSDVFGLGAILAVILTGQPPFAARSAETTRIQAAQANVEECFARLDACGAEPDLVALCKCCLSPKPADRPVDAGAVAMAVADFRAAADARARRAELDRVRAEGETAAAQAQALEVRKRQRLTLALAGALLAAALALLVGTGAAGWFAIRAQENARRADEKAREAEASAKRATERTERAYLADMRQVQRFWDDGQADPVLEFLERQRPEGTGGLDLRRFEWFYWDRQARSAVTLKGHAGAVHSVAFSPDGKRIVSGSGDRTVKVWDAGTGQEIRSLTGHAGDVHGVAISADGRRIVSGSGDRTVKVWDAESGQALRTLKGHAAVVFRVAISLDGKRIVSGSGDRAVKVWDAESGQEIRTLTGHAELVWSVAISADGKRIVSGSQDKTVKVWDAESGQEIRSLADHTAEVRSVAFSPDGKRIVSGSQDKTVKVWDAETGQELRTLTGHTDSVLCVAISPDGKRIVSGAGDRTLKVWDSSTGMQILSLKGRSNGVAFSPDGKRIVSGSLDRIVTVWSAERDPSALVLAGHFSQVTAMTLSPDGASIASAGGVWNAKLSRYASGELKLWTAGGQARDLLKQETGVTCVAFSPDGLLLASGSGTWDAKASRYASGEVRLWSADGRAVATLTGHSSSVLALAFSPDGSLLASSSLDGSVQVWDVAQRQKAFDLPGQQKAVSALAFSPDGALLATAGFDQIVTFYDLRKRKQVRAVATNSIVSCLAFSPDGSRLAVAGYILSGNIPVYEVVSGKPLVALRGHTNFPTGVAFSPDGRRIATCGEDRTVRLWDAASGQELLTLKGHTDIVRVVVFSKDGRRLVSGGWDRTVRVWDATPLGD